MMMKCKYCHMNNPEPPQLPWDIGRAFIFQFDKIARTPQLMDHLKDALARRGWLLSRAVNRQRIIALAKGITFNAAGAIHVIDEEAYELARLVLQEEGR